MDVGTNARPRAAAGIGRLAGALALLAVVGCGSVGPMDETGGLSAVGPEEWRMVASPEAAGWSAGGLASARALADSVKSAAVLLVHRGRVVAAWGDVDRPIRTYSIRKSLVSLLYGEPVESGLIDLQRPLSAVGLPAGVGLTEEEATATVADLMAARSGVYIPAAQETEGARARRPERGSHRPGTHWYYNNFDFNTVGWILERETGRDMFELFDERLARPLGLQDYDPAQGYHRLEPRNSPIPAYDFLLSARDLARVGQLVLQQGRWQNRRLVSEGWLRTSLQRHSELGGGAGYGYMWWLDPHRWLVPNVDTPTLDSVMSIGAVGGQGQLMLIIPELDVVVVHRGDPFAEGSVSDQQSFGVAEALLAARPSVRGHWSAGEQDRRALELRPLEATPFDHTLDPEPPPTPVRLPLDTLRSYTGRYVAGPMTIEVYLHEGQLFAAAGPSEEGLMATAIDRFRSPAIPLRMDFHRDQDGAVTGATVQTPEGRTVEARRLPEED